jgi:hypothetical protein
VNLKGPMESLEMDHFFQCLACLEIIFSKTHGVVGFGNLEFFFHLFVFNQKIIIVVTSIDK